MQKVIGGHPGVERWPPPFRSRASGEPSTCRPVLFLSIIKLIILLEHMSSGCSMGNYPEMSKVIQPMTKGGHALVAGPLAIFPTPPPLPPLPMPFALPLPFPLPFPTPLAQQQAPMMQGGQNYQQKASAAHYKMTKRVENRRRAPMKLALF